MVPYCELPHCFRCNEASLSLFKKGLLQRLRSEWLGLALAGKKWKKGLLGCSKDLLNDPITKSYGVWHRGYVWNGKCFTQSTEHPSIGVTMLGGHGYWVFKLT